MRPFDESGGAQAIRKCHRGKSCGPDELGNDWYRDHIDGLVPLFTKLRSIWLEGGAVPVTFRDSHVSCIKKTSGAAVPLDYRSIALLDSDYKIFTRVLATCLRQHLPTLVHSLQAGFVPGRDMNHVIDLFEAAIIAARDDQQSAKGMALLLDFAKAYDSLGRSFLLAVLRYLGLPGAFVRVVSL